MALPPAIPTLQLGSTGRWSRPDNVWISSALRDAVTLCDTDPSNRGFSDHLPIYTIIDIPIDTYEPPPTRNARLADWDNIRTYVKERLEQEELPGEIGSQEEFTAFVDMITRVLQGACEAHIPLAKARSHIKNWWTAELKALNLKTRKICRESHKWRGIREHPSHAARKAAEREYRRAIYMAKKTNWEEWLEEVGEDDIWTANKFAKAEATDGGAASIPTLKRTVAPGVEEAAATNEDKSAFLAATFFPAPPADAAVPPDTVYPQPLTADATISESTVLRHLARLSPYKAPGPDGIQNIVLTKCADIIAPWLVAVYNAVLRHGYYYAGWKEFTTVVLRKPDKPNYAVSKAYRPIALLCTMAKVLTAIVTEQLTYLSEQHGLLPPAQFGGRPGRTTTDSMHVLNDIITSAWAKGKVASVLFLDIEGAFPNAVPEVLIHDLKMRRVPSYIVNFVQLLLEGRSTQLKFDGYESMAFPVLNGIPQGDPMSLILYLFYGADLLRVPRGSKERVAGFVDDSALVAVGDTFDETHAILQDMYERRGGAREWAAKHFSRFETSKFKLMDFSRLPMRRPELQLGDVTIQPIHTHRFLGVIWDDQLKWTDQTNSAVAKGRKYVLAIRRLARIKRGLRPKFVRRLYISVAIPKMLYAVDIWCLPIPKDIPCARPTMAARRGSLGAIRRLSAIQRIAALTITGGLRSSPNDVLDIHANLLPMRLLVAKHCFRALTRISALPETHPLFPIAESSAATFPSKYRSPLQYLYHFFPEVTPHRVEDIIPMRHDPARTDLAFTTFIAESREESQTDNNTLESVIRTNHHHHQNSHGKGASYERRRRRNRRGRRREGWKKGKGT
ncbi:unnamed protein product [Peniophora sp. CBMAI 1063]|nr:unnamed protein product [Peniophora sp. CBMAI 1063]